MPNPTKRDITQLLSAVGGGDQAAAAELLPMVYDELRKLARVRMAAEPAQTLQPTALVHEAYLRLVGGEDAAQWDGRGHFFGAAALAMRRIMVERARACAQLKRGGDRQRMPLDENAVATEGAGPDLIELDRALDRLAAVEPRQAQVVTLRYFGGLTIEQAAVALNISPAMVRKEWTVARAWLFRELKERG